ncbi:hypothetical protein AXK57_00130 [Tsukamurella pulmonis]|uniref:hypothetical protein n=1 Tax=Tsukamurella pulmonis TaxID=47312 RepID=UPI0007995BA6|nr:hypothetical protein [Tsukamurella pulmonis]KXP12704.1 hypothetical protein AXK57_00130 [Tsukamurella pulmonis]
MTDTPDVIAQLRQMLTDAEAREDPVDAAWARHSLTRAEQTAAQLDAVEALLLALIPARERGALTALVIAERMPRITAAVGAAIAEAKRAADMEADRG